MMEEDIMNLDWQGAADYVEPRVGSRQVLLSVRVRVRVS